LHFQPFYPHVSQTALIFINVLRINENVYMISGVIKIAQKRQLNKEWAIEEEYGMSDESENNSIVKVENAERELLKFENTLIKYLERLSLPSSNIFVPVSERATVFFNVEGVLSRLSDTKLQNSVYT